MPDTHTPDTLDLPGGIQAEYGPGGAVAYYRNGSPWLARCPAAGIETATEFLTEFGVTMRVDLRDPACPEDLQVVNAPWPTVTHPLAPIDPAPGESRDRTDAYARHSDAVSAAAHAVAAHLHRGQVPLVHCRASADRTGSVIALLVAGRAGLPAAVADYAAAAKHGSHPRQPSEISKLLTVAAPVT
jgi:hypothetical protein